MNRYTISAAFGIAIGLAAAFVVAGGRNGRPSVTRATAGGVVRLEPSFVIVDDGVPFDGRHDGKFDGLFDRAGDWLADAIAAHGRCLSFFPEMTPEREAADASLSTAYHEFELRDRSTPASGEYCRHDAASLAASRETIRLSDAWERAAEKRLSYLAR